MVLFKSTSLLFPLLRTKVIAQMISYRRTTHYYGKRRATQDSRVTIYDLALSRPLPGFTVSIKLNHFYNRRIKTRNSRDFAEERGPWIELVIN
ncbi:hypothetical protein TNCV_3898621 [Trichonephila clavipes]|nr:hypothetical protein TNCV_3898621 [Trichonephila clavipes]